jgi:hypothetical protein
VVGNFGQAKSSPGGGIAAVETNKSGIAEAPVDDGEDATGTGLVVEEEVVVATDGASADDRLNVEWEPTPESDIVVELHV